MWSMENEQILTVMAEVLEEQKEMNHSQMETLELLRTIAAESKRVAEGPAQQYAGVTTIDSKVFEQAIESIKNEMKIWSTGQRLNNHQNNLRVFMESDAKKWAVYLVVALVFLTYLYWFLVHK